MPNIQKATKAKWIKQTKYKPKRDDSFYHTKVWRRLRHYYIKSHPLCEQCLKIGRTKRAEAVDHITPINDGGKALDVKNLQSLCKSCHSRKTNKERFGK